jgi:hypothetical protein
MYSINKCSFFCNFHIFVLNSSQGSVSLWDITGFIKSRIVCCWSLHFICAMIKVTEVGQWSEWPVEYIDFCIVGLWPFIYVLQTAQWFLGLWIWIAHSVCRAEHVFVYIYFLFMCLWWSTYYLYVIFQSYLASITKL